MGSSSGSGSGRTSSGSGSWTLQNSGSEEVMDERKRKRMISNRESARRSRMRKQKHLDDLASLVTQLRNENHQILTSVNLTTQKYLAVEAQNSVLRAQVNELGHRLESLNEIIDFTGGVFGPPTPLFEPDNSFFNNPFNMGYLNQPIMVSASTDMLQY